MRHAQFDIMAYYLLTLWSTVSYCVSMACLFVCLCHFLLNACYIMVAWLRCWLLFSPPVFLVCPITTTFALSRFIASDSTKCSSLALAMIALLGRLLGALALSWSLALFTCGSLDSLRFCFGHVRSACAPPRCACFNMVLPCSPPHA